MKRLMVSDRIYARVGTNHWRKADQVNSVELLSNVLIEPHLAQLQEMSVRLSHLLPVLLLDGTGTAIDCNYVASSRHKASAPDHYRRTDPATDSRDSSLPNVKTAKRTCALVGLVSRPGKVFS